MKRSTQHWGIPLILSALAGCASADHDGEDGKVAVTSASLCSTVSVDADDSDYTFVSGQKVLWTASGSCDSSPEYEFWFHNPSTGQWAITRAWGSSNTYLWDTAGLPTGQWDMQVWSRDAPSGNWFEAYSGRSFFLYSSPACDTETTTVSSQSVIKGTSVTFNSSATTCGQPEFEVWHIAPGGTYQVDSAYSTGNSTYVWDTSAAVTGTHWFQVWSRAQGSAQSYQARGPNFSVEVLGSTPCTAADFTFSPQTTAAVGTQVTITATGSGCASPTFEYWYQAPGGSYQLLQPYTSSPTAVFNTNLQPAGTFNFQVWVRAAGSTQSLDAYGYHSYTLTGSTSSSSIDGGYGHNCMLLASGKVGCWGYSNDGEVGNGTIADRVSSPVAVTGLTQGVSLGAGEYHTCAVLLGGAVKCWGSNTNGQLGNSTYTDSSTPVSVTGISSAAQVTGGTAHSCAALADGTAQCWGYNTQGQLGDGTKVGKNFPVSVSGLSGATALSAGYYHTCALINDGTVRCWGLNSSGQLGNGTVVNSLSPVTVTGLSGVTALSTYSNQTCALKSDGTIWCWGTNGSAPGSPGSPQSLATQISGVTSAKSMGIGSYHGCAVLQDGTGTCWGYNGYGQLGNATNTDSTTPVVVSSLSGAASIGVSRDTSCAVLTSGSAMCWGYGSLGTLGNGAIVNSNIPVAVSAIP